MIQGFQPDNGENLMMLPSGMRNHHTWKNNFEVKYWLFIWTYEWHCWAEPDRKSVLEKQSIIPNGNVLHEPDEKSNGNSPMLVNAQFVTLAIWNSILFTISFFETPTLASFWCHTQLLSSVAQSEFKFTCRLTNWPPKTYISPFNVAEQESTVLTPSPLLGWSHSYGP